jgi:hypothetical protein
MFYKISTRFIAHVVVLTTIDVFFLNSQPLAPAIEIASMILKVAASLLIENEALFPVPNNLRDDSSF